MEWSEIVAELDKVMAENKSMRAQLDAAYEELGVRYTGDEDLALHIHRAMTPKKVMTRYTIMVTIEAHNLEDAIKEATTSMANVVGLAMDGTSATPKQLEDANDWWGMAELSDE